MYRIYLLFRLMLIPLVCYVYDLMWLCVLLFLHFVVVRREGKHTCLPKLIVTMRRFWNGYRGTCFVLLGMRGNYRYFILEEWRIKVSWRGGIFEITFCLSKCNLRQWLEMYCLVYLCESLWALRLVNLVNCLEHSLHSNMTPIWVTSVWRLRVWLCL